MLFLTDSPLFLSIFSSPLSVNPVTLNSMILPMTVQSSERNREKRGKKKYIYIYHYVTVWMWDVSLEY